MKLEEYNNKTILITGINGFIGSLLASKLQSLGSKIINIEMSRLDVTSWNDIKNLDSVDIVFHLAAKTYVPYSFENPRLTYETNVLGTINLLEYCRENNSKMVFASTYVYGEPNYLPVDESHSTNASTPYSKSKLVGENLCKAYNDNFGVKSIILRPFNIFGPNQNINFLIPTIIKQVKTKQVILQDSRPKRDYVYIDDAIDAFLRAGIFNTNFDIFNIASGEGISVEEVVDRIFSQLSYVPELKFLNERREAEVLDIIGDNRKIKKLIGWEPQTSFDYGIKSILEVQNV